jgi:hypothetical protein
MRLARWTFVAALAAATVWLGSAAFTQDKGPNMEDAMKKWMDACRPGPHHKQLERLLGSWDVETSMWMDPAAPPAKSKGTAECKWLVEGKWIVTDAKGTFMGKPTSSHGVMGYDNFKHHFVFTQVDSMQTAMFHAEGNFDQSGQALIAYGVIDEPIDGENDKPVKRVWRFDGADRFVIEVHDLGIGETNTKVIEYAFTRRK